MPLLPGGAGTAGSAGVPTGGRSGGGGTVTPAGGLTDPLPPRGGMLNPPGRVSGCWRSTDTVPVDSKYPFGAVVGAAVVGAAVVGRGGVMPAAPGPGRPAGAPVNGPRGNGLG